MFANVTLTPQPNWELSTPGEVAIWGICLALAAVCVGWLIIALYTAVWPQRPRYVVLFLLASVALWFGATMAATRGYMRNAAQERLKYEREREAQERKIEVEKASP